MKVLIIEDELPAATKLIKLLELTEQPISILQVCRTVKESVNWLNNNPAPDLIFMDIELADGKSFEIFEQVKISAPVVFVTAYNEYAIKAIKLRALDYLLKPVTKPMLIEAIEASRQYVSASPGISQSLSDIRQLMNDMEEGKKPKKIAIKAKDSISFIEIDHISHLIADSNYTHLHLISGKKITIPRTLKEYEELLDSFGFFRIHNTYIINLSMVDKYIRGDGGQVVMKDGSTLEVSQSRKKELMQLLLIE